jgi:hypothetical protein
MVPPMPMPGQMQGFMGAGMPGYEMTPDMMAAYQMQMGMWPGMDPS